MITSPRTPRIHALGHALVDVLAHVDDDSLAGLGLEKGRSRLVDAGEAESILRSLPPARRVAGGSAANTAACAASLGASANFTACLGQDDLAHAFRDDIVSAGVTPNTNISLDPNLSTGTCLVAITPDGERSMAPTSARRP